MKVKAIPAAEVAYVLRKQLGPLREWSQCLTDMRAERTSVEGIRLLPSGVIHDGRCYRPFYTAEAIKEFIKDVRAVLSDTGKGEKDQPIHTYEVDIDFSDGREWKYRKVKAHSSSKPCMGRV